MQMVSCISGASFRPKITHEVFCERRVMMRTEVNDGRAADVFNVFSVHLHDERFNFCKRTVTVDGPDLTRVK